VTAHGAYAVLLIQVCQALGITFPHGAQWQGRSLFNNNIIGNFPDGLMHKTRVSIDKAGGLLALSIILRCLLMLVFRIDT
jgi:hypothetical protein